MAAWTLLDRIADWRQILTTAPDRRSRKYFLTIILSMLLGSGRRTVSCWLRAVGVTDDWQDHYYFLQTLGRSAKRVATELLHLAVKQIPVTLRDHPVQNSCMAMSGSRSRGWSTIRSGGCIGPPLLALTYVRQIDLQVLENIGKAPWKFRTKLELAAELVEWCVTLFQNWFQKRVLVVADGAYAKRPFLKRVIATGAAVVSQ